jgi:hypothetical protein
VKQFDEEKDQSQLKGEKWRKSLFEEETWRRGVRREKRI